jgi:lysophospholipase L1-like esterase
MPTRKSKRRSGSWFSRHRTAARVGVAAGAVLLTLMVVEAFLPNPEPLIANRYLRIKEYPPHTYTEYEDPIPDAPPGAPQHVTYTVDVDEHGFLEPSAVWDDADLDVVFLGGSTTECLLLPQGDRFPARVGPELHRLTGLRVNTYNGGLGGNDGMHSNLALVAKVLPMRPDAVVFMHGVNDLFVMGITGTYYHELPTRSLVVTPAQPTASWRLLKAIKDVTFPGIAHVIAGAAPGLGEGMKERAGVPVPPDDEFEPYRDVVSNPEPAQIRADFRSCVTQFVTTADAWGIEPVLMTQANRHTIPIQPGLAKDADKLTGTLNMPYEDFAQLHMDLNQITRDVAAEYDLTLVDLAAEIPPQERWIMDTVHYSPDGSRRAAEVIARDLAPLTQELAAAQGRRVDPSHIPPPKPPPPPPPGREPVDPPPPVDKPPQADKPAGDLGDWKR